MADPNAVERYDSRPDTYAHIQRVLEYMTRAVVRLLDRANVHDRSKLEPPEVAAFDRMTPLLKQLEYGSDDYKQSLKDLGPALEHHYEQNAHHPEHFVNGVRGMTLLDLVEMVCDWKAASERMRDPSGFAEGILLNQERWGFTDELAEILVNTGYELGFYSKDARDGALAALREKALLMPVVTDPEALAAEIRAGASFYMCHKMREYPHPSAPEITMAEHVPNDPSCKACRAEAALAELVALAARVPELEAALADYADVNGEQYDYDTLLFKYGEKSRALREYQQYASDLRVRAVAAEAHVAEIEAKLSALPCCSGPGHGRTEREQLVPVPACPACAGDGWYLDHDDDCYEYETGECDCSGVQRQCECQGQPIDRDTA